MLVCILADGFLRTYVQGDRLQELVSQLQAAIHPVSLPPQLDPFQQPDASVSKVSTSVKPQKRLRSKRKATQPLLPEVKQDSSADDQLH